MVSGPTHITQTTFVEDVDSELVNFGKPRTIQFRQSLPIHKHQQEIIRSVEENPVTLIQGSTGEFHLKIFKEFILKLNK